MTSVITDGEIVTFSLGLLAAGNETTTNLIINSFYCFLVDSPGIYEELRKEPNLILKAIEGSITLSLSCYIDPEDYSPFRTGKPIAFRHGMKVRLDTEYH